MKGIKRIGLGLLLWTAALSAAHLTLNVDWSSFVNDRLPLSQRKLNVAYIPVTCHLACPVTDFISRYSLDGNLFIPRMFQGFPEIKEALISDRMQVGFMVAPMAIALRAQGVPIKIVYLGHRYGSAVVVRKGGPIRSVPDLRGRVIAVPSRFSDERLLPDPVVLVGERPGVSRGPREPARDRSRADAEHPRERGAGEPLGEESHEVIEGAPRRLEAVVGAPATRAERAAAGAAQQSDASAVAGLHDAVPHDTARTGLAVRRALGEGT